MSALGQKRTYAAQQVMSALPPKSGHVQCKNRCPLWVLCHALTKLAAEPAAVGDLTDAVPVSVGFHKSISASLPQKLRKVRHGASWPFFLPKVRHATVVIFQRLNHRPDAP